MFDYITDFPDIDGINSIITVTDKATEITHLIPYSKTVTAAHTAQLYMREVAKIHGIPSIVYKTEVCSLSQNLGKNYGNCLGHS